MKYTPFTLLRLVAVCMFTALASCGIYRQNVVNVPLLQHKGQAQLGGHISFTGFEGQASCAVTDKFAVMASYADKGTKTITYSPDNYEIKKHNFGEVGAGLFKKTASGKIREYYAGAGKGMTTHNVQGLNAARVPQFNIQQVKYRRFFIQSNMDIGSSIDKIRVIFSPRLLYIHYYSIVDNSREDYKHLANAYVYGESAFTLQYNLNRLIRMSGQICATLPLTDFSERKFNYYYDFSPFNFSIGMVVSMSFLKP